MEPNVCNLSNKLQGDGNLSNQLDDHDNPAKILYSTRTHSQIKQAMKELKSSGYNGSVAAAVLGSRVKLCIHPELENNSNEIKTVKCKMKVKTKIQATDSNGNSKEKCLCEYYNTLDEIQNDHEYINGISKQILDIEDLVTEGTSKNFCPYYMARNVLAKRADIIFLPYNFVLDPKLCNSFENMKNYVIILDEAHNVPQVCEDTSSIEFSSAHLATGMEEIQFLIQSVSTIMEILN